MSESEASAAVHILRQQHTAVLAEARHHTLLVAWWLACLVMLVAVDWYVVDFTPAAVLARIGFQVFVVPAIGSVFGLYRIGSDVRRVLACRVEAERLRVALVTADRHREC